MDTDTDAVLRSSSDAPQAGQDEHATANYTIKDVTWRDRRRMRRYARQRGLAAREALTELLDRVEALDGRTEILEPTDGPTIDQDGADSGPPAPSGGLPARYRAWGEVFALMHQAGAKPPLWLSQALYRQGAEALGIAAPKTRPRKPAFQNGFAATGSHDPIGADRQAAESETTS